MARDGGIRVLVLETLAEVRAEMRAIGVDPGGVAIMAPKGVFCLLKLRRVDPRAANIIKQEMLARGGEAALADSVAAFSREPTDLLLGATLAQYASLIKKLYCQPIFGLPRLAEEMALVLAHTNPGWRPPERRSAARSAADPAAHPLPPPVPCRVATLPVGQRPLLAVSPEDPRLPQPATPEALTEAAAKAATLAAAGADLLALEASSPLADAVLAGRMAGRIPMPVAIRAGNPAVAEAAIAAGADLVALPAAMARGLGSQAAAAGVALLLVHAIEGEADDPLGEALAVFREALSHAAEAEVEGSRILLEPVWAGSPSPHRVFFRRLPELRSLGRPLWLCPPRPRVTTAAPGALAATIALAIDRGVDVIQINVAELPVAVAAARETASFSRHNSTANVD